MTRRNQAEQNKSDTRPQRASYYYASDRRARPAAGTMADAGTRRQSRSLRLLALFVSVLLLGVFSLWRQDTDSTPPPQPTVNTTSISPGEVNTSSPESLSVIVNKQHPLTPKDYVPLRLRAPEIPLRLDASRPEMQARDEVATALEEMAAAAKQDNIELTLESGYRSYEQQKTLYEYYVSVQGQTAADEQSARPGYSEHQTGLAVDIGGRSNPECNVKVCYATTLEGLWLKDNAHTYGFILRYPAGKEMVTGYTFEPWHYRYVGKSVAMDMHSVAAVTLEEYLDVSGGNIYR